MRVGPLSNDKVIDLLTKYFVPVWLSNDHFQLAAPSDAEQAEVRRIYGERMRKGLDSGTVCVVVLAPDGGVSATMNLHKASQVQNLVPFLQGIVDEQKPEPRSAETIKATTAPPRPPARAHEEGGMMLHVLTRFAEMKPNRGVSQDWFEWSADEWSAFAPASDAKAGDVQVVPKAPASKLFRRLYPPAGSWDPRNCQILAGKLTATVVDVADGETRLNLEGEVELAVPVGDDPTGGKVTAHLTGAARYDREHKKFTSFVLASEHAEFVRTWQGKTFPGKMLMGVEMEP